MGVGSSGGQPTPNPNPFDRCSGQGCIVFEFKNAESDGYRELIVSFLSVSDTGSVEKVHSREYRSWAEFTQSLAYRLNVGGKRFPTKAPHIK